jgi:arsenical pump membrane protein
LITAVLIFVLTLIFVLWQPRGLGIGWSALAGAGLALLFGVVQPKDIHLVWSIIWDPTITFIGLIVISLLLDEAGFFAWCAIHVAIWGKGNGTRLFLLIILLGASVSAIFANDGTALILTPIVLSVLFSLGFSPKGAMAFILATGFVADSTSLPLVISNLVNILSADYFHKSFGEYAKVMIPVNFAALGATLLTLWIYFRKSLPATYSALELPDPSTRIHDRLLFRATFPLLLLLLTTYFITAGSRIPVSVVTGIAAIIWLAIAGRWWKGGQGAVIPIKKVLKEAPWQIVLFSLGMYLVVYGLKNQGLTMEVGRLLTSMAAEGSFVSTIGSGFMFAFLSAGMNNLPTVLIGAIGIQQALHLSPLIKESMIYANIIGCDLGPKMTPIGSLATLLWLHVLEKKGEKISTGEYIKVGVIVTVPVLFLTLSALYGWLIFLHF